MVTASMITPPMVPMSNLLSLPALDPSDDEHEHDVICLAGHEQGCNPGQADYELHPYRAGESFPRVAYRPPDGEPVPGNKLAHGYSPNQ